MRIIAGKWRGKVIEAPQGGQTRPTSDRARESFFDILNSQLMKQGRSWEGIRFADVFAGSGAMGIEALSRGAATVVCVEKETRALYTLRQNIQGLKGIDVLGVDACQLPPCGVWDIVFMDAPYGKGLWQQALLSCEQAGWLDDNTLIIIETDKKLSEQMPEGYRLIQERSAGRNKFLFAKRSCEK